MLNGWHNTDGIQKHYVNDVLHNDDGPAWIDENYLGRHEEIRYYKNGRLHREDGPAYIIKFYKCEDRKYCRKVKFDRLEKRFFIKGISLTGYDHDVLVNKKMTVEFIDSLRNVETRRLFVEYYGLDKYIIDSKAEIVAQNECGTIYRKSQIFEEHEPGFGFYTIISDETIVVVKVKNSTPEADGSYKDYFIRVPPQFGKKKRKWLFFRDNSLVQDAIAWTFGLTAKEYQPTIET